MVISVLVSLFEIEHYWIEELIFTSSPAGEIETFSLLLCRNPNIERFRFFQFPSFCGGKVCPVIRHQNPFSKVVVVSARMTDSVLEILSVERITEGDF